MVACVACVGQPILTCGPRRPEMWRVARGRRTRESRTPQGREADSQSVMGRSRLCCIGPSPEVAQRPSPAQAGGKGSHHARLRNASQARTQHARSRTTLRSSMLPTRSFHPSGSRSRRSPPPPCPLQTPVDRIPRQPVSPRRCSCQGRP